MVGFYESIDFQANPLEDMPEPPSDCELNEELWDHLEAAHDENASGRKVGGLVNYLASADMLDELNYCALLEGVMEGPLLNGDDARKCRMATLSFIGRHRADLKYPKHWELVETILDGSHQSSWEEAASKGILLKEWGRYKESVLAMYLGDEDAKAVVDLDGKYSEHPQLVKRAHASCEACRSMFALEWAACQRQMYTAQVVQQLKDLEHEDFLLEEVDNVKSRFANRRPKSWCSCVPATRIPRSCSSGSANLLCLVTSCQLWPTPWRRMSFSISFGAGSNQFSSTLARWRPCGMRTYSSQKGRFKKLPNSRGSLRISSSRSCLAATL